MSNPSGRRSANEIDVEAVSMLRRFVRANVAVSEFLDRALPLRLRIDGNRTFATEIAPALLTADARVYDLGGGARPFISLSEKRRLKLFVVGLDLDAEELSKAPRGIYDEEIEADLTSFEGRADADVVICQATLEHVRDSEGALRGIASCVKPGGVVAIFSPSHNAVFARLNRVLPEGMKRRLLFTIYPEKGKGHDGFPAFYDKCLPSEVEVIAKRNGLELIERHLFWKSSYFYFFVPAFLAWRIWLGVSALLLGKDAAETYAYVFRRKP
ncbi:methyltransferase domain-containing protein [Mesorhizobium sp.]|uniref:class I SAM-dependent methyltransferase n=1 Tax=Mesorhizobium sp. TaxID=1871066 RepID=UPI000FE9CF33|nr:methyltransferase domain-containing protein [Mesorhizobium sp.]RWC62597.1 MAG: methyltransferase domain-containing protein [Mesorhizobium sp.]RWC63891.1 MAG: methyltransferase domain-containing protein [Mesorhizobium sp.]